MAADDKDLGFDLDTPKTDPRPHDALEVLRSSYIEHGKKLGALEQRLEELATHLESDMEELRMKLKRTREELKELRARFEAAKP